MLTTFPGNIQGSYSLKEGDSFLVCDAQGDIYGDSDGLFHEGTRTLSRLRHCLDGDQPTLLSAAIAQDKVVFTSHLTNQPLPPIGGNPAAQGVIHIERSRFLWSGRLYERIECVNYAENEVVLPLLVEFGADFRDMFEVRGMQRARRGDYPPVELSADAATLRYLGLDETLRSTVISFSMSPSSLTEEKARFDVRLLPHQGVELYLEVGTEPSRPGRERYRAAAIQAQRRHMVILIDEFGGTAGIVTLRDVLERIVGDVRSEKEAGWPDVEKISEREALIDGLLLIQDVNEYFGLELDEEEYHTIGGYVFGALGRRPEVGDVIEAPGWRLVVETLDGLRGSRLRLVLEQPVPTPSDFPPEV